jgi:ribonucleoside-diphosphate reductase alpha chain
MEYKRNEAFDASLEYFKNDSLAADVFVNKYALKATKDGDTVYYERTPDDMHRRIAKELHRIENKYKNPLSEDFIFELLRDFKYIIPGGSPMSGIGNDAQVVSLSNCFVIGNTADSYGSICQIDEEQIQLMKRRGGVGHDLSHIRPAGLPVKNSALTSTGIVPFMNRYSNSTNEVAQGGRRGALMLSCSIQHPDSEEFIDAKLEQGKVTGANISVKLTDDFMQAALNANMFEQIFPIGSKNPILTKQVDANKLWKKIIHNAWKSAEPGVLFWDTVMKESIPDCYQDFGFTTVSTNPCGEITLCPYDSCRLLSLNLYGFVDNPFTSTATFNWDKFEQYTIYAERFMDDIVDLEIEKIEKIIEKIESDPELDNVKRTEKEVWHKIMDMTTKGRRTGLGVTAEGDMLAALGYRYGTKEATDFSALIHQKLAISAYKSSAIMAKERGSFPVYDYNRELNNPFIQRLKNTDPELDEMLKCGRRNIALLTIAPTGSVSILAQTTSGIEPAYLVSYKRRRKINPNDKIGRVDFVDSEGVKWEEYNVFHHKFETWLDINGYNVDDVKNMKDSDLQKIIELSPYYKATSNDVDWVEKVRMQGAIQKFVDHSISVTVNLPNSVTEEIVSKVYETGWKCGCKGLTVYRDGSRQGVIMSNEGTTQNVVSEPKENNAKKRPIRLECDVVRFTNNKEKWIGFLGLMVDEKTGEKYPYELFTGLADEFQVPIYVEKGETVKFKEKPIDGEEAQSRYDFVYKDKDGYTVIMQGLNRAFDREFWNISKLVSAILRHRVHLPSVIGIIDGLEFNDTMAFGTWKSGVKRIIKKYINSTILNESCPNCGATVPDLIYENGCKTCKSCGWGKCE